MRMWNRLKKDLQSVNVLFLVEALYLTLFFNGWIFTTPYPSWFFIVNSPVFTLTTI